MHNSTVPEYECFSTHLSFGESLKAITDSKHLVPLRDADPDGWTDSSIHACCRGANIQHRHIEVALRAQKKKTSIKCDFDCLIITGNIERMLQLLMMLWGVNQYMVSGLLSVPCWADSGHYHRCSEKPNPEASSAAWSRPCWFYTSLIFSVSCRRWNHNSSWQG